MTENQFTKFGDDSGQTQYVTQEQHSRAVAATDSKLLTFENLMIAVVIALMISSVASLISVGAIILDQLHFNNQTYRDYSNMISDSAVQKLELQNLKEQLFELQNCDCP